jgi:tripartite-type tricarboxylate transporter receptor subunit TctC
VQEESSLDRTLWTIVLAVAVAVVVLSFARQPLLGGESEASGFSPPLTLWLAGPQTGGQAEAVARQAASCWESTGRPVTVGVLPGSSSTAVTEFLDRVHHAPGDLLLITSTTVSDIAHDSANTGFSVAGERAQRAAHLLEDAPPVAVLAGDKLNLAVRATSPIRNVTQLFALLRRESSRPLLGIAESTWLEGNLATLVQSAALRGQVPYSVFRSSREAVMSLGAGEVEAVVAPHSALREELSEKRLRELHWPGPRRVSPRSWLAVIAPAGLSSAELTALRAQTRHLCSGTTWTTMLGRDGLLRMTPSGPALENYIRNDLGEESRRQALAAHIVRDY